MKHFKKTSSLLAVIIPFVISVPFASAEVIRVGPDSGDYCTDPVPTGIAYRPSLFECNGNAALLLSGDFRKAYSVVLRRNGFRNDRDRVNNECSLASCSPFKVQKKIELPEYEVNCLGDTGFGLEFAFANRIAVKFSADIDNARDPNQYQQYCLKDKQAPLN